MCPPRLHPAYGHVGTPDEDGAPTRGAPTTVHDCANAVGEALVASPFASGVRSAPYTGPAAAQRRIDVMHDADNHPRRFRMLRLTRARGDRRPNAETTRARLDTATRPAETGLPTQPTSSAPRQHMPRTRRRWDRCRQTPGAPEPRRSRPPEPTARGMARGLHWEIGSPVDARRGDTLPESPVRRRGARDHSSKRAGSRMEVR